MILVIQEWPNQFSLKITRHNNIMPFSPASYYRKKTELNLI